MTPVKGCDPPKGVMTHSLRSTVLGTYSIQFSTMLSHLTETRITALIFLNFYFLHPSEMLAPLD